LFLSDNLFQGSTIKHHIFAKIQSIKHHVWHPGGFEKSPARCPGGFEIRRKKIARKKQLLAISYITFSQ